MVYVVSSCILHFSVFMLTVAESLPETSEFIPLLSEYLNLTQTQSTFPIHGFGVPFILFYSFLLLLCCFVAMWLCAVL